jgi:2-amino-4-hydroxy-6-hydroxymethyldihydropteridine diphosphokinase
VTAIAYLGLGSNLGDRFANLLAGAAALDEHPDITVRRMATVLETEPVGVTGHQSYFNTVLEIETSCPAEQLMEACLEVELGRGRQRSDDGTCAPRQLDIDILLLGDQVLTTSTIEIPHPRMHDRAFVLVPMVELAPDVVHPVLGASMEELLQAEIEAHGPVSDRCAILSPGSLLDDGPMSGPAGLPAS